MARQIENDALTETGKRIKAACDAKGWTVAELGRRCGWGPTKVYSRLRIGAMPANDAILIARILNMSLGKLMTDERGIDR